MSKLHLKDAVIASGSSTSAAVDLEQVEIIGVRVPATVTGTALTIKTSDSTTGTFNTYQTSTGAVSITIAGGEDIQLNPPIAIARAAKIDTGAAEGAERTFQFITRQFL